EPPEVGAREHVARVPRRDRNVCEAIEARRELAADVALEPARAGREADDAERFARRAVEPPRVLEAGLHRRLLPQEPDGVPHLALGGVETLEEGPDPRVLDVESDAARAHEAAPEAAPADERRHAEELAAEPAAEGGGREVADVAGERAEVARVVREPFELERDRPERLGARRDPAAGERLDRLAVRDRMADRGVARERLGVVHAALVRPADERALDPAVLVAERDLEVQHLLAVALEAEVSGLDDPRVHGPDRHLVDLLPVDAEEPGRLRRAERLRPRMADEREPALLGHLAFERVHLRAFRRERRPASRRPRRDEGEARLLPVGEDGDEPHLARVRRLAEQRRDARARRHGPEDGVAEFRDREHGQRRLRRPLGVPEPEHARHPTSRAAASSAVHRVLGTQTPSPRTTAPSAAAGAIPSHGSRPPRAPSALPCAMPSTLVAMPTNTTTRLATKPTAS